MDCSPPGSSVHRISHARKLEWHPRDFLGKETGVGCHFLLQGTFPMQGLNASPDSPALAGGCFTTEHTQKEHHRDLLTVLIHMGFPGHSHSKESSCKAGDSGSIPGLERPPGDGNGYHIQYSCLDSSMDRGAWRATVHGIANSWTQLKD